jgi:hypothetical protein
VALTSVQDRSATGAAAAAPAGFELQRTVDGLAVLRQPAPDGGGHASYMACRRISGGADAVREALMQLGGNEDTGAGVWPWRDVVLADTGSANTGEVVFRATLPPPVRYEFAVYWSALPRRVCTHCSAQFAGTSVLSAVYTVCSGACFKSWRVTCAAVVQNPMQRAIMSPRELHLRMRAADDGAGMHLLRLQSAPPAEVNLSVPSNSSHVAAHVASLAVHIAPLPEAAPEPPASASASGAAAAGLQAASQVTLVVAWDLGGELSAPASSGTFANLTSGFEQAWMNDLLLTLNRLECQARFQQSW